MSDKPTTTTQKPVHEADKPAEKTGNQSGQSEQSDRKLPDNPPKYGEGIKTP